MPKISPSTRRALTEQRKAQILTAAAKVFAAKGFERATIAGIARAAGAAEGSIYNYFKNKGDLLVSIPRQIVEPAVESISGQMFATAAAPLTPEEALTTVARTMLATVKQNAHIFRILIASIPSMKQATREKYLNQVVMYATGRLETYFREQIRQGVFRSDLNVRIAARTFIGMFFPFVMLQDVLQVEGPEQFDYEKIIPACVQLFLHGAVVEAAERKSR